MKKILFILSIILFAISFGQITNISGSDVAKVIDDAKTIAIGINSVGFVPWIKSNWYFFLLSLVGLGSLIVKITPTKKDDKWYGKYILKPVRLIGNFLSLNIKK